MKALLVSNDFLPQVGGIQQYSDNIARRLPAAAAFAAAHAEAAACDAQLPYPVYRGPSRYMLPTPRVSKALAAAARAEQASVVLFMAPWPLPALGRRLELPFAVCTHGAEVVLPARVPGVAAALRRSWAGAGCIFTVSAYTGRHVRHLVGRHGPPVRYLRTGVPLDTFHPDADGAGVRQRYGLGDDPVVVCVGRLVPRKGQDTLIRALPLVRRRVPGARLLLVGDGPHRKQLERMAAELAPGAVTFAGRVPWPDLPAHHAAGDVFACPTRSRYWGLEQEGFGVTYLEAQACQRPVIAGRSGGSPEALIDGETGVVVDGSRVEAVAAALVDLLSDPAEARRMGKAGRAFVEQNFDWDHIVRRLADDLGVVAAGGNVPSDL